MLDVLQGNPHCSAVGEMPILVLPSCPAAFYGCPRRGDGIGSILRASRTEEEP